MPQWSSCDLHCLDWNDSDVNLLGVCGLKLLVYEALKLLVYEALS